MATVIKLNWSCVKQAGCNYRFTEMKVGPKAGPGPKLTLEESWQETLDQGVNILSEMDILWQDRILRDRSTLKLACVIFYH